MWNFVKRLVIIFSLLNFITIFPTFINCQDIIFHENVNNDKNYGIFKLIPIPSDTTAGLTRTSPVVTTRNIRKTMMTSWTSTLTSSNGNKCEIVCVTLDFCTNLFKLLQEPTIKNLQILKNASCGFTPDGDPLVLCDDFLCDKRSGNSSNISNKSSGGVINTTASTLLNITTSSLPSTILAPTTTVSGVENNLLRSRALNPLNNDDCGTAFPSRINGGQSASRGEFPWIVGIALHSSSGPQIICGGALVADDWVLTAAHCVADSGHRVRNISHIRVGAFNITDKKEEGAEDIGVSKVIFHDKFRERPVVKHDIALLKLKQKVTLGLNIGSICVPNSTSEETYYDTKSITTIAGWGSDGIQSGYNLLQKVDIPIVPGDNCKRIFYRVRIRVLPDLQVCAGATGKDSCKGDSGGPLMSVINGRTVLIGIISYGTVKCDGSLPGVYTKVTSYMDWIRDNIIKNS